MIKKAVIPAAGRGTRLLPATYAQPKEMLPCGRKPTIQYVVEELDAAGVEDILFVTGRTKRALEDHFDRDRVVIEGLENAGKVDLLKDLSFLDKLNVNFFFTRQAEPVGLADAIGLAKDFIAADDFIVALGDTIIYSEPNGNFLAKLIQIHQNRMSKGVIGLELVDIKEVYKYGVIKGIQESDNLWRIEDLIEKPVVQEAPSRLAICGRYIFTPDIFDAIEKTPFGVGGEKQLTDAIKIMINDHAEMWGLVLTENAREKRYDIGNPYSYAVAFIELCLKDPDLKDQLKPFLRDLVKKLDADKK